MCTFNIEIEDSIISRIRPSFKNDAEIKNWMQTQVVNLMINYEVSPVASTTAINDREAALEFIKSLAVKGGNKVPANVSGIESLISEKYEQKDLY